MHLYFVREKSVSIQLFHNWGSKLNLKIDPIIDFMRVRSMLPLAKGLLVGSIFFMNLVDANLMAFYIIFDSALVYLVPFWVGSIRGCLGQIVFDFMRRLKLVWWALITIIPCVFYLDENKLYSFYKETERNCKTIFFHYSIIQSHTFEK